MYAGCRTIELFDAAQSVRLPLWVLHPTRAEEREQRFGPYSVAVASDAPIQAPIEGERLPLVVISHGNNGSPWTHRDLALRLAREGFVVALLEHIGNSRSDGTAPIGATLENRPRHVRLVIDAVLSDPSLGARIALDRIFVIGQSIGGYTALAVAGGRPSVLPHQTDDGLPHPVSVVRDPRVAAIVLLAPATGWYMGEGALADVDLPILMLTGELDEVTPSNHAEIVLRGVPHPERIEHRVVPNAGHFSFQSPFPPAMNRPDFPPSQDPPGFDRAGYQPQLQQEILSFLLACPTRP